jgi:hypothetical protein
MGKRNCHQVAHQPTVQCQGVGQRFTLNRTIGMNF